jgi:hypothetical protein
LTKNRGRNDLATAWNLARVERLEALFDLGGKRSLPERERDLTALQVLLHSGERGFLVRRKLGVVAGLQDAREEGEVGGTIHH